MAPAAVVMLVLGEPIIRILFQRGQFDTYSTTITSYALFYYALGLLSFGGIKIMSTAFYALQDTRVGQKVLSPLFLRVQPVRIQRRFYAHCYLTVGCGAVRE